MLFILTIPLDKCQMKSFKHINISIEVRLFYLNNVFWVGKSFYVKEKYLFEKKCFISKTVN